jgi:hypothetical protein
MRLLLLLAFSTTALAQSQPIVTLVTSDIDHFWQAYDASEPGNRAEAFQKLYLDVASPGLKDFVQARIRSANALARTVDSLPKYYASIRKTTAQVDTQRGAIEHALGRFKELYPEARFPTVYFVIGRLTSGGTTGNSGLLIGVEVNALGEGVDVSELQQKMASFLRAMGPVNQLPPIVVHELVHYQQKSYGGSLLGSSMIEGAADFVTEVVAGGGMNDYQRKWAEPRRDELFHQFAQDMATDPKKTEGWLYNYDQVKGDQPADLGYWIGREICRSYYDRAGDKTAAFGAIVQMRKPEDIVRASAYSWILEPKPPQLP